MKKLLLKFLGVFVVLTAFTFQTFAAEEDVTNTYLTNPGFDISCNYLSSDAASNLASANGGANLKAVNGWTLGDKGDNSAAATFEYGYTGTLNTTGTVPTTGSDGTSAGSGHGALGISTAWTGTVTYFQTVTLPAGTYKIKYVAKNTGPNATDNSRVGWVPTTGTAVLATRTSFPIGEWIEDVVQFTLSAPTEGKIQVGINAPNVGSGGVGRIFFDYVQLLKVNDPIVNVDKPSLKFDFFTKVNSFVVSGSNLTANVSLTAPTGISLDKTTLTIAEVHAGVTVTATHDGSTVISGGEISISTTGAASKVITVNADPSDATSAIVNPNISNGTTGWTATTGAQNKATATNQNVGAFEGTMPFYENWNPSPFTGKIYQVVNNLPAGRYILKMGVFANNGGEGLFVYADTYETPVSNAAVPAFFEVEFTTAGGSVEIGLNVKSGTNNWVGIDNVSLKYLGAVSDPILSVTPSQLLLSTEPKTFKVVASNLTNDVQYTTSVPGVTFNPTSISKDNPNLAAGVDVTVTFNANASGALNTTSEIVVSSTGTISKTVAVITSKDGACYTPSYPNNLAPDPMFNDVTQMRGWGAKSQIFDASKAYCGMGVGFSNGGSYDQLVLWKANTSYVVKAQINANTTEVQLGVYGIGKGDVTKKPTDKTKWELVEFGFTSGESPTATGGVFFNGAGATGAYIDNLEVYEAWVVTFNSNGGSDVPVQYAVKDQKAIAPTAPVKENATFAGWYIDEALNTAWNFDTDKVTADMTLYAKWDTGTGVSTNFENEEVINIEYFNVQCQKVNQPVRNTVYFVKKTYASQKTQVDKIVFIEK